MSGMLPKIGVMLPMFTGDPARVLGAARDAEALGFQGVFGFDHLFRVGGPPDGPALECFTTLSAVAAVTERVAVGTLVTRVGLRPPGVLGKLAAGLDHVSGGRAILGMGTGDRISDEEHRRYGFVIEPPEDRVERLTETVAALQALFGAGAYPGGALIPPLEGPLVPAAVQSGGPPIWVGGTSDAVVRAAARGARAWNGWGLSVGEFERKVRVLNEHTAAHEATGERAAGAPEATWGGIVVVGEDGSDAERLSAERSARGLAPATFTGSVDALAEHLGALGAAGATWTILLLAGPADRRTLVAERLL
jgi:alkanesulfonate monooxygenase SsuD/methylene tetrahydromethanopterin reductase-like flavin-dependent oxidoreductase (luciferase family)